VPVYEYMCCKCEEIFEAIHSINNSLPEIIDECPCCQKKNCQIKKLISLTNFRVKGPPKNPMTRTGYVNYGSAKTYSNKKPNFVRGDVAPAETEPACSDCPDL